jgi:AcrR family transcriptional regulator
MNAKTTKLEPDRRVRRTHRQLRDALVALILERGWDEVSVQDVCAKADIGRSTFYTHFADKEALLLSGFDELHTSLNTLRVSQEGAFGFAFALIEHAKDNLRLFRAVVGRRSGQRVLRRFRDVVLRLVEADLESLGVQELQRAAVARYVGGGFVELMTAWLDRPSSMDPAALAATFRQLTFGALASIGIREPKDPATRR